MRLNLGRRPAGAQAIASAPGFTVVELLVAAAIVAVLAGIALPTYADYVRRARIVDAIQRMAEMRVKNEQYFLDYRTYRKAAGCGADDQYSDHFDIVCTAATATRYEIRARGRNAMSDFEYAVDQDNAKETTRLPRGWSGANARCWVVRRNGSCD